MRKKNLLLLLLAALVTSAFGQGARNIKINEVLTKNTASIQNEYGENTTWIELVNTSFSTYNVRGMYITTDRRVLNKKLTVPERVAMMSCIPDGEDRTIMSAHKHLIFYLNSNPAKGSFHLNEKVDGDKPVWIALYDGNAIDIIDSVTVPVLAANESFAREKDGSETWHTKAPENVTPGIENYIHVNETKIARLKREDPAGIGITVLSMGIVFACLALLYVFFRILGIFMAHKQTLKKAGKIQPIKATVKTGKIIVETGHKTNVLLKDGLHSKGIDKEIYIAVISMALKQYQDNVHDIESNVITIKPHKTHWNLLPEEPIMP